MFPLPGHPQPQIGSSSIFPFPLPFPFLFPTLPPPIPAPPNERRRRGAKLSIEAIIGIGKEGTGQVEGTHTNEGTRSEKGQPKEGERNGVEDGPFRLCTIRPGPNRPVEANVCGKSGKVLRKVAKGEELVMLASGGAGRPTRKKPKVSFCLTAEEKAQIRESEARGDSARGFACHRCGKVFSYEYYRDKHLKFTRCVDNGQRRFPCPKCQRSFEKRDRLRIHILHVHENHRPHACHLCGKAFSQSSSLNKHLRTHSGERPYQCPNCEKAFTASSILRTHIRQHSGEKPFKCAHCGKCFASHAAHDSHIRRSHN